MKKLILWLNNEFFTPVDIIVVLIALWSTDNIFVGFLIIAVSISLFDSFAKKIKNDPIRKNK